ncbi:hypothetical protein A3J17_02880 [Candidatus Curtissbacteria bacterium RIFCSPLOWO2_02_FULL_40_11]|uniref:Glycosyl transferase family 1 domain-containing protein n=2 Tax=Candidatus Curtissiibacteriota TaxID=1752717 RepID=A0A1F5G9T2_9BACT|nr:MAG: hypothetical protein A3D04_01170 [Candidatus Curtissbacteria bacterium RIFCSPHIGHO2_02_FULL_40_16b]OGD99284.1 MAG: hypothetical protein A3J17_02880 [Candidatus Curtissbacteria bacterium RIFCSPLOWO2_02_FULL_40_11]OGE13793.1 MAG: hypothetical protein A3G14_03665 [Candidatus Curtissbacteria bacterium RIFCSPLOWO2_12_FULL_38_9]
MSYQPKVALVHDDFLQRGGAENLFATIAGLYPKAPIYTSLVNWQKLPSSIEKSWIKTSWMQKIPLAKYFYKALLPLYPFAFESFDLSKYDLVISSTTRFANCVITKPGTVHVSYVNTTPRFLWSAKSLSHYLPTLLIFLFKPVLNHLKKWDKIAASRADFYIANSTNVKSRIKKFYGRDSQVLYPFANTHFFKPAKIHNWPLKNKNYYLVVSRLVRWKKIELAIKAAAYLNKNLIIVGEGPDKKRLQGVAKSSNNSVEFQGRISLAKLRDLYNNCLALIVTQEEDFGIAAVEAQSCGRPVIAYRSGGVREIIKDKKTGILYPEQSVPAIKDAIEKSLQLKWNDQIIRRNALRFSKRKFETNLTGAVQSYVKKNSGS